MPAYVPAMDALGLKSVSVFRRNPERGLPVIHAIVGLVDPETGQPLAIMDGTYLTALRTGAVSGAAADLLARPDSRVLAAIGAGAQGVTQIAAVCAVRPIERVIAVDVNEAALERLRQIAAQRLARDRVTSRNDDRLGRGGARGGHHLHRDHVAHAGFRDEDVRPGTHISAVGAYTPEMQELPAETVARATVVVDAIDAALAEAGDLIIPLRDGLGVARALRSGARDGGERRRAGADVRRRDHALQIGRQRRSGRRRRQARGRAGAGARDRDGDRPDVADSLTR